MTSPVYVDLLKSLGLNAHVIEGYTMARSLHRKSSHHAIVVRDLQTKGDAYLLDVGTFPPFSRPMEITNLLRAETNKENKRKKNSICSPIFDDMGFSYQIV